MTGWLKPLGKSHGGYMHTPIVLMVVGILGLTNWDDPSNPP